jgi:hypothetical protein
VRRRNQCHCYTAAMSGGFRQGPDASGTDQQASGLHPAQPGVNRRQRRMQLLCNGRRPRGAEGLQHREHLRLDGAWATRCRPIMSITDVSLRPRTWPSDLRNFEGAHQNSKGEGPYVHGQSVA